MTSGLVVVDSIHYQPQSLLLATWLDHGLLLLLRLILVVLHGRWYVSNLLLHVLLLTTLPLHHSLVHQLTLFDDLLDHLVTSITVTNGVLLSLSVLTFSYTLTLPKQPPQVDVGYNVLVHALLRVDGFRLREFFVVGVSDPKIHPTIRDGFQVGYLFHRDGGISGSIIHRTLKLTPLELFVVVEEIHHGPPVCLSSAHILLHSLTEWNLNLHDHQRIRVGWYLIDLMRVSKDDPVELLILCFGFTRIHQPRLINHILSIVHTEHNLPVVGSPR